MEIVRNTTILDFATSKGLLRVWIKSQQKQMLSIIDMCWIVSNRTSLMQINAVNKYFFENCLNVNIWSMSYVGKQQLNRMGPIFYESIKVIQTRMASIIQIAAMSEEGCYYNFGLYIIVEITSKRQHNENIANVVYKARQRLLYKLVFIFVAFMLSSITDLQNISMFVSSISGLSGSFFKQSMMLKTIGFIM